MKKIGIIGVGKMGGAFLKGILNNPQYGKDDLILSAHSKNEAFKAEGFEVTDDISYLVNNVEVVILAIKPQMFKGVFSSLEINNPNLLIVSLAAGIKIEEISSYFHSTNIIRLMPNTPLTIGKGMTSISPSSSVKGEDIDRVKEICSSMGETCLIKEEQIDTFIPLVGSMPAFFFTFVKAFAEISPQYGIEYDEAVRLVLEACIGSSELAKSSNKSLEELINDVTSKGGTTLAGREALKEFEFERAIQECFKACYNRSVELGKLK